MLCIHSTVYSILCVHSTAYSILCIHSTVYSILCIHSTVYSILCIHSTVHSIVYIVCSLNRVTVKPEFLTFLMNTVPFFSPHPPQAAISYQHDDENEVGN